VLWGGGRGWFHPLRAYAEFELIILLCVFLLSQIMSIKKRDLESCWCSSFCQEAHGRWRRRQVNSIFRYPEFTWAGQWNIKIRSQAIIFTDKKRKNLQYIASSVSSFRL
jgi:hypothetical protein